MAADETTTWGEVCKRVGLRDNLYRTCRDKVPDFSGFQSPYDAVPGQPTGDEDFDSQLARRAQPIPPPPPAGWEPEPEFLGGVLGDINLEMILVYGGLAAAVWWFFFRKEGAAPAPQQQPAQTPVTATKAA